MRIVSGSTSEYLYFVAVSTSDYVTRVTDLTSFTVYGVVAGSTAPTFTSSVSAVNSTQTPGVYKLLLADSTVMTIPSGVDSREVCLHITSSMAPVTRTFELYRRTATTGATITVDSSGAGNANVVEIAGAAPSTGTAHFGVNVVSMTADSIAAAAVSTAAAVKVADFTLDRDMSAGTDSGSPTVRTVRQALRILRNKWAISGTTQTVYKEDDATASWSQVLTGTSGVDPVTGTDPAGP
jgi:hypothetical protein